MTRLDPLESSIAGHTRRHLTATTYCQPGRSRSDATQLIEDIVQGTAQPAGGGFRHHIKVSWTANPSQ